MEVTETPDRWVVVKTPECHKVFGTWNDGRWRLNSGIKSVEEDEEHYYFIGYSGSNYKCRKDGDGLASNYGRMVLGNIMSKGVELVEGLGSLCDKNDD